MVYKELQSIYGTLYITNMKESNIQVKTIILKSVRRYKNPVYKWKYSIKLWSRKKAYSRNPKEWECFTRTWSSKEANYRNKYISISNSSMPKSIK